jgi:uncharacterized protein YndB with AHSA1/START domain
LIESGDEMVERSVRFAAPAAEVWEAITEPAGLSAWVGGEVVSLEVRPGGRGLLRREDGAVRRIVVELVEPGRRLRFRWWPFARPDARASLGSTTVDLTLDEQGATTTLRVVERPPLSGARSAHGTASQLALDAEHAAGLLEAVAR